MKANIDDIASFYKNLIQEISNIKDLTEFESSLEIGKKVYELSNAVCNKYFNIVMGICERQ